MSQAAAKAKAAIPEPQWPSLAKEVAAKAKAEQQKPEWPSLQEPAYRECQSLQQAAAAVMAED